jgi:hypothetical protein
MFYVELPFRPWRRKDRPTSSHTERYDGGSGSAGQSTPSAEPVEVPRRYTPPNPPLEGKRSRRLDKLAQQARSLRAAAEKSEFEDRIRDLEVRAFVAADVLVAAAALVEDDVTQSEQGEARTLIRSLLDQA